MAPFYSGTRSSCRALGLSRRAVAILSVVLGLTGLGFFLYWLLVLTEGTYLGPKVVALLYDWTARRYDKIKRFDFIEETHLIGLPLTERLEGIARPKVLDVATGTGRVPTALLCGAGLGGLIWGVDRSRRMLLEAARHLEGWDEVALGVQEASQLGFADESFDAVVCLEALEFMPSAERAIGEIYRVLKPGGTVLVSNRVGRDARHFVRRLCGRGRVEQHLVRQGFDDVTTQRWQVHYDLVWARKADQDGQTLTHGRTRRSKRT